MAEKDIKKSLSLKIRKGPGSKQSKSSVGSKNVTIQVKRKKIIVPSIPEEKDSLLVTDKISVVSKESADIAKDSVKTTDVKKESAAIKVNFGIKPRLIF